MGDLNSLQSSKNEYACLHIAVEKELEAMTEKIIYCITSYMDSVGMMPCDRGSAERTVAFAPTEKGYSIYDDVADRISFEALDGIGRCLSGKFSTYGIGIIGSKNDKMMRLYQKGRRKDVYCTSKDTMDSLCCKTRCFKHAVRWNSVVFGNAGGKNKVNNTDRLFDAFLLGKENSHEGFESLYNIMELDPSVRYGFASLDDGELKGLISLYFCHSNRVRQSLLGKVFNGSKYRHEAVGSPSSVKNTFSAEKQFSMKSSFFKFSWGV